jgi:trans-AT polyketide synthase, acyltransferase and oxidoreductase domains
MAILSQTKDNGLRFSGSPCVQGPMWVGSLDSIAFEPQAIHRELSNLEKPCYLVRYQGQIGVTNEGNLIDNANGESSTIETLTAVAPLLAQQLGDPSFLSCYGVKYAYMTGAMANGIASEDMVIALGKQNILSSFGAAGLVPTRIVQAIHRIQAALPDKPYAFNLIHSPSEATIEQRAVELYLKYGVNTVEASAFLNLTPNIVYYRAAGLSLDSENRIQVQNRVIAKISRPEVATQFLQPAPSKILKQLVSQGLITELQAKLAQQIPMADDITVEADSGGHTDNRPLVCLLPSILSLRDQMQQHYGYEQTIRVGAAGGIGTPHAALGALMMGAAYVVTGSINQACVESGASAHTKNLLAQAEMADFMMAPAADMFELGVKLQVLKRGTLFPMRAQKLYEIYKTYNSIEEIPQRDRSSLETQIFKRSLEEIWQETVIYFSGRDREQITRASENPKRKMALIFRWYLGLSSRWSMAGETGREMDYQIWCGPAMGAFNAWVKDSDLAKPDNRRVADVAEQIMMGAAFLYRLQSLKLQGISLPVPCWNCSPSFLRDSLIPESQPRSGAG